MTEGVPITARRELSRSPAERKEEKGKKKKRKLKAPEDVIEKSNDIGHFKRTRNKNMDRG